ncbi:MAG: hypothetical protein PHX74_06530 [Candidatus Sumerlaeales bacterium]|nr:hypothetical protein [Candidatus Sumerlaeales bacterium]
MAFDLNNFVIERISRGTMLSSADKSVLWVLNQIEEPGLSVTSDSRDAVDALGTPIMTFEKGKQAEFTAQNSLLDLSLLAAQSGTSKVYASGSAKILVPAFEELTWTAGTDVTLEHIAVGTTGAEVPFIYALNGDGTTAKKYTAGTNAAAGIYKIVAATKTITPPTDAVEGERVLAIYNYAADGTADKDAVAISNSAKNFPTAGRFIMEVLGADVCNISVKYKAFLIFPQAKLLSDYNLDFTTEGKHPFTIKAMQNYCDHEKRLFDLIVPEA